MVMKIYIKATSSLKVGFVKIRHYFYRYFLGK